ncbi:MAG TPA: S1/P1 nuclease [Pyrinomonadaceae bacterium]|nr:S1/P1 nuclease [Pyrinomonadaceae bacterium]
MKKLFGLLLFSALFAATAQGWDDTGHKIIGEIAWQKMTPAARDKAVAVLMGAPEDSDILTLLPSDSRPLALRRQQMFYTMTYWADLMRSEQFPKRRKEFHHGTWHYLDTFWREANGRIEIVTEMKADDENAVERLFKFDKTLSDAGESKTDKAIALAWILHLAGDIHQPLHCSARVTPEEPKGDHGGNTFLLAPAAKPGDRPDNLHWYWDSVVTRNIKRVGDDECDSDYIPRLAAGIMKKHPQQRFAAGIKPGKYDQWQQEGYLITTKELYPASLKRNQAPPESYRKRALAISEQQMALAGYRIADMLNRILGS